MKKSKSTSRLDVSQRIIKFKRKRLDADQNDLRLPSMTSSNLMKLPVLGERNTSNFGWPTAGHVKSFSKSEEIRLSAIIFW